MRVLIIEDEIAASKQLIQILTRIGQFNILATLDSISETEEWFSVNEMPDLLFMDIHLADGNSFEVFRRVRITCPVIFTTAYDEYALRAFKVNSIDYLLKPVEEADVRNALGKLTGLTSSVSLQTAIDRLLMSVNQKRKYKTHFLVPAKGDKLIPVNTNEVAFFSIYEGVVRATTSDGRNVKFDNTMDELEGMLDPEEFFRANRQFIVSRRSINDIDLWFNGRLSLNLTVKVPEKILVSKARMSEFKSWFNG
ncbi:MAG: LytTR family DNA-binding domain-containing protein [Bacteroidales bacterium]